MCRMIGIRNYSRREHEGLLEKFSLLAEEGKVPEGSAPGHNDGWGIGYYRRGRAVLHKTASSILRDKEDFRRLSRDADGSPVVIVHLRKSAWPHTSTSENAHPFLHDNFMFAHNGTISDYKSLLPFLKVKPSGIRRALDTEVYFHFIMSHLHLGIKAALRHSAGHICRENAFTSLNCLLAGEKGLLAYRQYSGNPAYYSLYHARAGASDIVCSEPVAESLCWKMLRKGSLLVL